MISFKYDHHHYFHIIIRIEADQFENWIYTLLSLHFIEEIFLLVREGV